MLIALLGFYTLVTGRITDGSARLKDGAGQASAGATQLKDGAGKLRQPDAGQADTGAGKLSAGADKVHAGISEKLAPGAQKLQAGADQLAAGADKVETDVNNKLAPGVYKVDDGARKLAAGSQAALRHSARPRLPATRTTTWPTAPRSLTPVRPGLRLDPAILRPERTGSRATGAPATTQEPARERRPSRRPSSCFGPQHQDPVQGLVPLSVVKDKIAKISAGAKKLDAGAAQLQAGAGTPLRLERTSCRRGRAG